MRRDLASAMKARDQAVVAALKTALAAIDNAEAVADERSAPREGSSEHIAGATAGAGSSDVPRKVLSEAEMQAIVRGQIDERSEAADLYEKLGRADQATRLRREAAVLTAYLPE
jgi:uncharacterized protein YqeY